MNVGRKGATSFVYENKVFVAGGCDSSVIEVLKLNKDSPRWKISEATLLYTCQLLRSVVYQNRAILFCACDETDHCAELCLIPPYTCKKLCKLPEPQRDDYTVVAFDRQF